MKTKYIIIFIIVLIFGTVLALIYNCNTYISKDGVIIEDTVLLEKPCPEKLDNNQIIKILNKGTKIRIIRRIEESEGWYFEVEDKENQQKGYIYYVYAEN